MTLFSSQPRLTIPCSRDTLIRSRTLHDVIPKT
uniref:Uncharacterized protein n=1 Tax=Bacteriophage sp. TaxID=38018 RepID=A0A8D9UHT3_9VIRU|nr:MAG TPA: hypothetical protein [Bacteriophage sp.]